MVGLLPLCATTVIEPWQRERVPARHGGLDGAPPAHARAAAEHPSRPGPATRASPAAASSRWSTRSGCAASSRGCSTRSEFLSPYGIRSLSRYHLEHPYVFKVGTAGVPGGLPARRVRHRDVRRQLQLARPGLVAGQRAAHPRAAAVLPLLRRQLQGRVPDRLGPDDEPVRGGARSSRRASRASSCATRTGRRPVYGGAEKFQTDPHWRDCILFYEYFHGDNGAGLGASHQTGWTGLVARLIQMFGALEPRALLEGGKRGFHAASCGR